MLLDLTYQNRIQRRTLNREIKILMATYHYRHTTKDVEVIAEYVNVKPEQVRHWQTTKTWNQSMEFWSRYCNYASKIPIAPPETEPERVGDLRKSAKYWTEMFSEEDHVT